MNTSTTNLFVYGTLRSAFGHIAHQLICKHFDLLGEARVRGKLYDMGEYPAAIKTNEQLFIRGELYELKNTGVFISAMAELDDYEGVNLESPEESLFVKEVTTVYLRNDPAEAWMYWYNQPITLQPLISSGQIADYMTYKSKQ